MNLTTSTSTNGSALHSVKQPSWVNEFAITVMCVLIIVVGTIGNTSVIILFGWKRRNGRSKNELLLLLLAIADLLSCISLPVVIMRRYGSIVTSSSEALCLTSELLNSYSVSSSHVIIFIICIERFRKITSPLAPGMTLKSIFICLAIGFAIGIIITFPLFTSLSGLCKEIHDRRPGSFDLGKFTWQYITYLALNLLRDILSILAMAILICKMLTFLSRNQTLQLSDPNGTRLRKFAAARKMLIVMILSFSVCVLPHSTYFLVIISMIYSRYDFGSETRVSALLSSTVYVKILLVISSMINPIIYSFMHPEFVKLRQNFVSLFCRFLRHQRTVSLPNMMNSLDKISPNTENISASPSTI